MAINKNHEFEELSGIKCAIVERNVSQERAEFLREILERNNYTVIIIPSSEQKPLIPAAENPEASIAESPIQPVTYTLGVTDVSFNPVNAIFGRLLKTKDNRTVTLAFWQQKESESRDDVPYFAR